MPDEHYPCGPNRVTAVCCREKGAGRKFCAGVSLILTLLLGGCGLFSDSSPREVRVSIDGEVTTSIILVTSKEFERKEVPNGNQPAKREIQVVSADTATIFPPAQRVIDISDTKRFMLRATRRRPDQDRLKLRVRIDGQLMYEFDAANVTEQDSTIQYVYIYRE